MVIWPLIKIDEEEKVLIRFDQHCKYELTELDEVVAYHNHS